MSISVAAGQSFEATLTGAPTGLVGTMGVRVMDGVGGTAVARATAGIVESPAGSGIYTATITAPAAVGSYVITWDTGVVSPETTATEDLTVTLAGPLGSPWAPDYVTLAQLKSTLRITDTADDAELGYAISAASRAVDHYCRRQFGNTAAPPTARYFSAYWDHYRSRYVVPVDDLFTTTGLVVKINAADDQATFATTLALDTDLRLSPFNAPEEGRPWTALIGAPGSAYTLPTRERSVEVTARWGWSAVPAVVTQATLIQASRLFKRRDAPFGVAGSPEMGSELRLLDRLDPDVAVLLGSVRRAGVMVA